MGSVRFAILLVSGILGIVACTYVTNEAPTTDEGSAGPGGAPFGEGRSGGTSGAGEDVSDECSGGTFDHDTKPSTVCQSWSKCEPGQYIFEEGTPTTDRVCAACITGTFTSRQNAEECERWLECAPGEYAEAPGTAENDRQCSPCFGGTFSAGRNAAACTSWTDCGHSWKQLKAGTAVSDSSCNVARQFGSSGYDYVFDSVGDGGGGIYLVGVTYGSLDQSYAGDGDAYVRRYGPNGVVQWSEQFGTAQSDDANGIAADATGGVIVVGSTSGSLGTNNLGGGDCFVRMYDGQGTEQSTWQFGTTEHDSAIAVAVDEEGNFIVAGGTYGNFGGTNTGEIDAFVRKYASGGEVLWTRQFGTDALDVVTDVGVGNGYVCVTGQTDGELQGTNAGGFDAFIRCYSDDGDLRWTRQFGTAAHDFASSVEITSTGQVYVAGKLSSGTSAANADAFLRKYNGSGSELWTQQFGSSEDDQAASLAVDENGHVFVAGSTYGALDGMTFGGEDIFVRKYDSGGNILWTRQVGTTERDFSVGISVWNRDVHVTGGTFGGLEGANAGLQDVFVLLVEPP